MADRDKGDREGELSSNFRGTADPSPEWLGQPARATALAGVRDSDQARPWIGIAANARSGRARGRLAVDRLARELARLGYEARVAWTVEDRQALVAGSADASDPCHCLVAVGGDGTVAALINECPDVPIAVLPAGTENLFARHFGFEKDPGRAARRIVEGRAGALDLGQIGNRRFALMAGFGFDGDVVTRHHRARLERTGMPGPTNRVAYVEPVLRSSLGYRFPALTLTADLADGRQETLVGTTAFVFNLPSYALGLPFAPDARGDDGWLDLVVFKEPGPFRALMYLWLVIRGLHLDRPGIIHRRVRRVAIEADIASVPFQLDGDPGGVVIPGNPPWIIDILPAAINVLLPGVMNGSRPLLKAR